MKPISSLYVHFPFCEVKCHYCDFYSLAKHRTDESQNRGFLDTLRRECEERASWLAGSLETIFFGGGTPSMTTASEMQYALEPLHLEKRLGPDTEWTMEANPSSVSLQSLKEYRELGVNRISMGSQALKDELLRSMGRVHSSKEALQALDLIFEAGFQRVSVDLLCGIPDQSEVDLREAIEAFTSFPIDHLSVYLLTLPPKHFLSSRLPEESVQSRHLEVVHEEMLSRGFLHYEISNFAKPGGEARHNLNYWHGGSCLGLGPSAHSFEASQGVRWKNFSSLHSYAQAFELASTASQPPWNERVQEYEKLTAQQRELEKWMLQLRLAEGFPLTWCTDIQLNRARILVRDGLLEAHPERLHTLRPTLRGMILSESVIEFLVG